VHKDAGTGNPMTEIKKDNLMSKKTFSFEVSNFICRLFPERTQLINTHTMGDYKSGGQLKSSLPVKNTRRVIVYLGAAWE